MKVSGAQALVLLRGTTVLWGVILGDDSVLRAVVVRILGELTFVRIFWMTFVLRIL